VILVLVFLTIAVTIYTANYILQNNIYFEKKN